MPRMFALKWVTRNGRGKARALYPPYINFVGTAPYTPGKWERKIRGIVLCCRGWHVFHTPHSAATYAHGDQLWLAEVRGKGTNGDYYRRRLPTPQALPWRDRYRKWVYPEMRLLVPLGTRKQMRSVMIIARAMAKAIAGTRRAPSATARRRRPTRAGGGQLSGQRRP